MIDFENAKKLLYDYVDVVTRIKRNVDFQSHFCSSSTIHSTDRNVNTSENSTIDAKSCDLLIYSGYLKTIDPVSKSSILCHIENDSVVENILILGQNISDIRLSLDVEAVIPQLNVQQIVEMDILTKSASHPYFYRPMEQRTMSKECLIGRQYSILQWLKQHRIPTELDDVTSEIVIAQCARIKPPYHHESDYICPTRIVLKRIMHIVDSMPKPEDEVYCSESKNHDDEHNVISSELV